MPFYSSSVDSITFSTTHHDLVFWNVKGGLNAIGSETTGSVLSNVELRTLLDISASR